jgi:hypothetical protein
MYQEGMMINIQYIQIKETEGLLLHDDHKLSRQMQG